jgi:hypothetical protein
MGQCSGMTPERNRTAVRFRPPWIPWWPLAAAVSLATAVALAAAYGRIIEAIIIGVILGPPLALIALWAIAWRRDQLDDAER